MDLLLIRHAAPDYARDGLTGEGKRQAKLLGRYLADVPLTHIYCSPMGRARDTLAPTAKAHKAIEPVSLDWMAELDGRVRPHLWAWDAPGHQLSSEPELVERLDELLAPQQARLVEHFLGMLAGHGYARRPDGLFALPNPPADTRPVAALFAHAGWITTLLAGLFELPLARLYCRVKYAPSAITHLRMAHVAGVGELRLISYATRPHLPPAEAFSASDRPYMGA
jgi:probable phosphoglycerate mutase